MIYSSTCIQNCHPTSGHRYHRVLPECKMVIHKYWFIPQWKPKNFCKCPFRHASICFPLPTNSTYKLSKVGGSSFSHLYCILHVCWSKGILVYVSSLLHLMHKRGTHATLRFMDGCCTSYPLNTRTNKCLFCLCLWISEFVNSKQNNVHVGGDSNDKPMAMQLRLMTRSQCWTRVSKRIGSLSAPDVNSTNNNQPWKTPAIASRAANQVVYWLSVSPGRRGWTRVRIPQQAFFKRWLLSVLLTCGALSNPVLIDTVVKQKNA